MNEPASRENTQQINGNVPSSKRWFKPSTRTHNNASSCHFYSPIIANSLPGGRDATSSQGKTQLDPSAKKNWTGTLINELPNHNATVHKWKACMASPILLARADNFTVESKIPRLGQIVSLPNPRCRMGFQLKPSLLTELFSQNSIFPNE